VEAEISIAEVGGQLRLRRPVAFQAIVHLPAAFQLVGVGVDAPQAAERPGDQARRRHRVVEGMERDGMPARLDARAHVGEHAPDDAVGRAHAGGGFDREHGVERGVAGRVGLRRQIRITVRWPWPRSMS